MGTRVLEVAEALLRRAGYRAGETDATCGSGQTDAYPWSGGVDDHRGVAERAWPNGTHLVTEYTTAPSSSSGERFAQTLLARYDSRKEWHVRCC